jgi:pimeloyl-ACP methyl ester carboxylesterase
MFEGFASRELETERGPIHARVGGAGPPLLLLHGYPQTHLMWHAAAPLLAERFTVVVTDLSGYGDSLRPAPAPDHAPHSKRALARDQVQAMISLGHERFAVAGHDRGGRVAYRMALDHPDRVRALAVLDIVPTAEVWVLTADVRSSARCWCWGAPEARSSCSTETCWPCGANGHAMCAAGVWRPRTFSSRTVPSRPQKNSRRSSKRRTTDVTRARARGRAGGSESARRRCAARCARTRS